MEFDFYDVNDDIVTIAKSIRYSLGDIFNRYSEYTFDGDDKRIEVDLKLLKFKLLLLKDICSTYKPSIRYEQANAVHSFIQCCETTIRFVKLPSTAYHVERMEEQRDRFLDVCELLQKTFR
ncbi:hypothetical protein FAX13_06085 [Ligilactobacillus animalis]|nr:hypothetical protein FAX13_06085 [Ligilactobacillus animalis]